MREIKRFDLESINYYQVPKWLMNLFISGKISAGAFKTYVLMYERLRISDKNNWIDENGLVYIRYSYDEMQEDLQISRQAISNNLKDLLELDLIVKVKNFNSSSKFYLKIYDSSQDNFTNKEKLTNSSLKKLTNSSQVFLDANNNNFNNNNFKKNDVVPLDEESIVGDLKLENPEDKPNNELDEKAVEFKNNIRELREIAVNSTGLNKIQVDGVIRPYTYKDIDLSILLEKIKQSDFLMGKCENKPTIVHFTQLSMINKILADYYKNKVTSTEQPKINPARVMRWS